MRSRQAAASSSAGLDHGFEGFAQDEGRGALTLERIRNSVDKDLWGFDADEASIADESDGEGWPACEVAGIEP